MYAMTISRLAITDLGSVWRDAQTGSKGGATTEGDFNDGSTSTCALTCDVA
jgi:hypothetical protein